MTMMFGIGWVTNFGEEQSINLVRLDVTNFDQLVCRASLYGKFLEHSLLRELEHFGLGGLLRMVR